MSTRPGWNKGAIQHASPMRLENKRSNDVIEECKREPLQDRGDLIISKISYGDGDAHSKDDCKSLRIDPGQHFRSVGHTSEICADGNNVRDKQCGRANR